MYNCVFFPRSACFEMASILDMSVSSDSDDDVDYLPPKTGAASDSSCDELSDEESFNNCGKLNEVKNQTKKGKEVKDAAGSDSNLAIDEKKRANELWKSFLNDVESVATNNKSNSTKMCNGNKTSGVIPSLESDMKVSKIQSKPVSSEMKFEFAGETVTSFVKNGNTCDSAAEKTDSQSVTHTTEKGPLCMPKKRGIDCLLGSIMNKNKKLTVLEKSKIDWDAFKKDAKLENLLENFNKGKNGFIERQRFLERSDIRSFEMEKSMRQTLRKK